MFWYRLYLCFYWYFLFYGSRHLAQPGWWQIASVPLEQSALTCLHVRYESVYAVCLLTDMSSAKMILVMGWIFWMESNTRITVIWIIIKNWNYGGKKFEQDTWKRNVFHSSSLQHSFSVGLIIALPSARYSQTKHSTRETDDTSIGLKMIAFSAPMSSIRSINAN